MFGLTVLDLVLLATLVSYAFYGFRNGFLVTMGGIIGFALGAVAAFLAMPLVSSLVPDPRWRLTAVVTAAVVLVVLGNSLGASLGHRLRSARPVRALRGVDRLAGAAVSLVMTALVMSLLAFGLNSMGVPVISQQVADSRVIRFIDGATPAPVQGAMAQLRSGLMGEGIPKIIDGAAPLLTGPGPVGSADTPQLQAAAQSVLKITGTAYQCGQNQTGTGFVVSSERVVTNAHVVAGVTEPVVETPSGAALAARVVYFDPQRDLAVLAVNGLNSKPLPLRGNLPTGSEAAFEGYPHGGPYQAKPARVQGISQVDIPDIYGSTQVMGDVYQIAGDVEPGNSGGPLLSTDGKVAGVVFAKASASQGIGFALTMDSLQPVANRAASLDTPVSSGQCTRK
ncbi:MULTISPECIES: MarP family serine protease [Arthrobacter]|uniref:MarP family serine protease n=2 Tax=Arthrobacter TaxID=1663 RepID=A0ABU9KL05_9MICC|nr:MarP family serine protease [Arthrobacter sp. YJM1]MDP5227589.1 MarP family serine protease [Arthrobacter sp. YJM1]